MFKVEYIRTADEVMSYTDTDGTKKTYVMHKKGTKINRGHSYKTRKYETKETMERYTPNWKERDIYHWLTKEKQNVERFTYQYDGKQWVRIN